MIMIIITKNKKCVQAWTRKSESKKKVLKRLETNEEVMMNEWNETIQKWITTATTKKLKFVLIALKTRWRNCVIFKKN